MNSKHKEQGFFPIKKRKKEKGNRACKQLGRRRGASSKPVTGFSSDPSHGSLRLNLNF